MLIIMPFFMLPSCSSVSSNNGKKNANKANLLPGNHPWADCQSDPYVTIYKCSTAPTEDSRNTTLPFKRLYQTPHQFKWLWTNHALVYFVSIHFKHNGTTLLAPLPVSGTLVKPWHGHWTYHWIPIQIYHMWLHQESQQHFGHPCFVTTTIYTNLANTCLEKRTN